MTERHIAIRPAVAGILLLLTALLSGCGGGGGTPRVNQRPNSPNSPSEPSGFRITSTRITGAIAGVPYTTTLTAQGGTEPYKWDLPQSIYSGWSLTEDGILNGTWPEFNGGTSELDFTIRATDSATPAGSVTATVLLNVFGIRPTTLISPQVGVDFTQLGTFVAGGGTPLFRWSLEGTPPTGLVFQMDPADPTGRQFQLAGIPTQPGTFQFSITASDSASPIRTQTIIFQVQVKGPQLKFPHATLPIGTVGKIYDFSFVASGGTPPLSWSLNPVQLPAGLLFDGANGRLLGTPTAPGYASFVVMIRDSELPFEQRAERPFWVLVTPNELPPRNDSVADATPIFPGTYNASLSPYSDPPTLSGPDEDYYQLTAGAGTILTITVGAAEAGRPLDQSTLEPVVELVNSTGQRYATCNDPFDDNLPPELPVLQDPTPNGFDDPCMNHGTDPTVFGPARSSRLHFQVPGASGDETFYIHVFDYRGDARPDMFYTLMVQ